MLAGPGDVVQAGEQAGALGPPPAEALVPAAQGGNRGRYEAGRRGGASLAGQDGAGEGSGVLVVIEQPGSGLVPVTTGVHAAGQGAGVLADQVVHPVPAAPAGNQVLVIQGLQAAARGAHAGAVQGGGGVGVDVGAGVQPEPPNSRCWSGARS